MTIKEKLSDFTDSICDWLAASLGIILIAVFVFCLFFFAGFFYLIYQSAISEKIEIPKADWECTQTVTHYSTTYVKSGDILIPIDSKIDECVNYRKKH